MKKIILFIGLFLFVQIVFAQAPQSFKYQAVIRYNDGGIVQNQLVSLRISIIADHPLSDAVYVETHSVSTNQFGIANLNVGEGTVQSGTFSAINWGANAYYIQTELDVTGDENFQFIGVSRLESVPYALFAANAVNVDDADADPTNEIQVLSIENNILYLSDGGEIDLSPYLDNTDEQTIELTGTTLSISNGNSIELSGEVDLDSDPTNELQFLSMSNDTIYLSDGGFVKLPAIYYEDILNTPDFTEWDQDVSDDFSGDYNDLSNKPQAIHEFNLDAGNNTINNVQNPVNAQDAATKAYVDSSIVEVVKYSVGDFAQGGIVFWVDETGQHGLVAATNDIDGGNGVAVSSDSWTLRVYSDGIYAGESNTLMHVIKSGSTNLAPGLCFLFSVVQDEVNYGDWYLPSKEELNIMYQNKDLIDSVSVLNGGTAFIAEYYWSSTTGPNDNDAWSQSFDPPYTGYQVSQNVETNLRVRPIRSF